MATAKKLPSGSWRVQVYAGKGLNGKPQYMSFTRPSKKEAEYEALQWQLHYKEISKDTSAMTLAEAMDRYIASKDGILSPSTVRGYDIIKRNHLQGLMGFRLNRLTQAMVQEAVNQESKTLTPKSVRNVYGLLSAVLSEYHPGLRLNITLPQKKITEQQVLEPEHISTLLHAVEDSEMEIPILLAVWMCMRSSEITGLTWDCVDFQHKTITVKKARVRNKENTWVEKNSTKTINSTRVLNAPDYIIGKLRIAQRSATTDHVVNIHGNCLYHRLKVILKNNGLPSIRFHDLRHTSASIMAMLNIPTLYAQRRGGWSSPRVLQQTYEHVMQTKRRTVDEQINNFYINLIKGEVT